MELSADWWTTVQLLCFVCEPETGADCILRGAVCTLKIQSVPGSPNYGTPDLPKLSSPEAKNTVTQKV